MPPSSHSSSTTGQNRGKQGSKKLVVVLAAGVAAFSAAAAAVLIDRLWRRTEFQEEEEQSRVAKAMRILEEFEKSSSTPVEKLKLVAEDLIAMMEKGLVDEDNSDVKMLASYVDRLPTGDDVGLFYALDLGGTNFRVMLVALHGRHSTVKVKQRSYQVPAELKLGSIHELFDYMAERVAAFVTEEEGADFQLLPGQRRQLGFSFSFPVHNKKINSGTLLNWTKGFNIKDAIGKDMVEELEKALERQGLDMHVAALVNDAVGTFAEGRYYDDDCLVGMILGTGTNAAYVERIEEIKKLNDNPPTAEYTVINMEWGNFHSPNLPWTEYDVKLHSLSVHPNEQVLEKMISGRYLGELVRVVLLKMAEEAAFFGETVPPKLKEKNILKTDVISAMHGDTSPNLDIIGRNIMYLLEVPEFSLEQRKVVLKLCDIVAKRSARLSAAAIYGILKKLGRHCKGENGTVPRTVIEIDGSLHGKYEQFRNYLNVALEELLGSEVYQMLKLQQASDGSGIGAAILAASHAIKDPLICEEPMKL